MLIKVIKDSVIYRGVIYPLDKEFECDDAIAESLIGRGYVEPVRGFYEEEELENEVTSDNEEVKGHLDPTDLAENYSYQELKKLASDLGVSANGKKEELIERICSVEVGYSPDAVVEVEEEEESDELPNTSMPEDL